jgi:ATP-dependent exoDNAse (exonuclease V) alpha subunit
MAFKTVDQLADPNDVLSSLNNRHEPDPLDTVLPPAKVEDVVLSEEQEQVWEIIQSRQNILVTGSAGTGKSTILKALYKRLGATFHVTASTGIAAVGIGGATIYAWAGLGKGDRSADEIAAGLIRNESRQWARIKTVTHLAIDEISMLPAGVLELLDHVMRIVRRCDEPFGGCQMIFFGDFLQLPPVQKEQTNITFAFQSQLWKEANIKTVLLTKVYRQTEARFSGALNDIRRGVVSDLARAVLQERFDAGKNMVDDGKPPVIIHMTNVDVEAENTRRIEALPGEPVKIEANDFGLQGALLTLQKNCLAPKELLLKPGARVMLLKNVNPEYGLANGSTGTLKEIIVKEEGALSWKRTVYTPVVEFDNGITISIQKAKFETVEDGRVVATREQYPLRLAWSITSHKSQGMTLDKIQVFLEKVFEPGQAYVALSRARTMEGLFIMSRKPGAIGAHPEAVKFYFGDEEPVESDEVYEPAAVPVLPTPSTEQAPEGQRKPEGPVLEPPPTSPEPEPEPPSNVPAGHTHICRSCSTTYEAGSSEVWDAECRCGGEIWQIKADPVKRVRKKKEPEAPAAARAELKPDPDDNIPMEHPDDYRRAVEEMVDAIEEADSRDGIVFAIRTFRKLYPKQ